MQRRLTVRAGGRRSSARRRRRRKVRGNVDATAPVRSVVRHKRAEELKPRRVQRAAATSHACGVACKHAAVQPKRRAVCASERDAAAERGGAVAQQRDAAQACARRALRCEACDGEV